MVLDCNIKLKVQKSKERDEYVVCGLKHHVMGEGHEWNIVVRIIQFDKRRNFQKFRNSRMQSLSQMRYSKGYSSSLYGMHDAKRNWNLIFDFCTLFLKTRPKVCLNEWPSSDFDSFMLRISSQCEKKHLCYCHEVNLFSRPYLFAFFCNSARRFRQIYADSL
jgi:hypothetical protein